MMDKVLSLCLHVVSEALLPLFSRHPNATNKCGTTRHIQHLLSAAFDKALEAFPVNPLSPLSPFELHEFSIESFELHCDQHHLGCLMQALHTSSS